MKKEYNIEARDLEMKTIQEHITVVVPQRGINDEGTGKKYALYRLRME